MTAPTATTTVYGCSDDLVELDGAIYDEFSAYDRDTRLKFNNGATLIVRYDRDGDGIWRIESPQAHPSVTIVRCEDREGYTDPDGDIYSDLATVVGATSVKRKAIKRGVMTDVEQITCPECGGSGLMTYPFVGDNCPCMTCSTDGYERGRGWIDTTKETS